MSEQARANQSPNTQVSDPAQIEGILDKIHNMVNEDKDNLTGSIRELMTRSRQLLKAYAAQVENVKTIAAALDQEKKDHSVTKSDLALLKSDVENCKAEKKSLTEEAVVEGA